MTTQLKAIDFASHPASADPVTQGGTKGHRAD